MIDTNDAAGVGEILPVQAVWHGQQEVALVIVDGIDGTVSEGN